MNSHAQDPAPPHRLDAARRVAELEAEIAALRRALARPGRAAERSGRLRGNDLIDERAGREADAAETRSAAIEAEARHRREMSAGRADLAASESVNDALRRANAALAESRAALRESEERLRLVLDSAADYAIFTTGLDRRVTSWNAGAERLLGWSEAEIVGRLADPIFTPEDRAAGMPEREAGGALRDGRAVNERWHQRRDGRRFWASGLAMPLRDPAGGPDAPPLGLLNIMRDRTEQRRAEEALRQGEARWRGLFERMHEGFALCEMVHDPGGQAVDFRYLEVNPAWERLTGIPASATVGRLATEAIPGIEEFWVRTYARVVETGEPAHFEHHLTALGRWFEVLAYRTEPGRFAAVFLNVTERKAAEARRDALVELGDRLRDLRDPAEIAGAAAEVIGRALGADRAGYGTVDAAQEVFRVERDWTAGSVAGLAREHRLAEYWRGFAEEHGRGEVVAVGDVERDPRAAARTCAFAALDVRALLNVPVVEGGRVAAILYVHQAAPREWTAEEVAFVRGAAERAWAAAARARAEEELRAEKARLRFALDAGRLGAWELDVAADSAARSPRHDAIFGYAEPPPVWGFEQFLRHVLPEDRARVERGFRAAVEGGGEWHFECRIRRAGDGEERWIEARGQPVRDARGRQVRLLGAVADITDRKLAEQRRALLVNEMNHRAKNALAVVQAMLRLTKAADVATFVRSVEGRVAALARAHTLLADQQWAGSSLHDLVRGELAPFMAGRATIDGPAVTLPATSAQPVAMAVHELATNAAKHGALSAAAGTVAVAWRVEGRDLRIRWTERGGPRIDGAPERSGFGSRLLDGTIRTQLRGTVEKTWDASGLVCDVVVPLA